MKSCLFLGAILFALTICLSIAESDLRTLDRGTIEKTRASAGGKVQSVEEAPADRSTETKAGVVVPETGSHGGIKPGRPYEDVIVQKVGENGSVERRTRFANHGFQVIPTVKQEAESLVQDACSTISMWKQLPLHPEEDTVQSKRDDRDDQHNQKDVLARAAALGHQDQIPDAANFITEFDQLG